MRVIIQRAINAKCSVEEITTGQITKGFMILVGFTHTDTKNEIEKIIKKMIGLRIFEDENGKLNKSILDVGGAILAISQFTLYADCRKGNRPSFTQAMTYEEASKLFETFLKELKKYPIDVQTGVFGANMQIQFTNDGPVTILLDSKNL